MTELRYPVGPCPKTTSLSPEQRAEHVAAIESMPRALRDSVAGLSDAQLDTPYRDGGWTVRQLVHHLADSHMNAYTRFKLALSEENPTIRRYDEQRWAEFPEARSAPIDVSLALLDALHARWTIVLRALASDDYSRPYVHPDSGPGTVDSLLATYGWHSRHHVAHVTRLREREGWAGGAPDAARSPAVPLASGAALRLDAALARIPTTDGTPFELLFRRGTLEVEMYAPQGRDPQTPHTRDEVYVVARGTARFAVEGTETTVGPGDLLFVPAGVEHRFAEFSPDFATWVVFYG